MKVEVYNQTGDKKGQVELSGGVFDAKINLDLVHQVVISQMANQRQGTAQAKDRSEVSGGGKKPWRQKGTGRARHGSIRSPLWRGGGITFGPRSEKVYYKSIPTKMRRAALKMVLSAKVKANLLIVVDSFDLTNPKTKLAAAFINKLPVEGSVLVITAKNNENFYRAGRNLSGVAIVEARNLSALSVLSYKYLVLEKEAIAVLQGMFK
ncbi:MAG: 50S ribosomal protein L4 [Candidatus Pacebacteria bacterium]|nr:50S ribosomal protein L4 [Candidatus Paceibacterota bacterium]